MSLSSSSLEEVDVKSVALDGLPDKETFKITATDGTSLFVRVFPFPEPLKGVVAVVHGYAEHSGRYAAVAARLAREGYGTIAFDVRGHGHSGGIRGGCVSYSEFLSDVDVFLKVAAEKAGNHRLFLLGHSHGGLITLRRLLNGPFGVNITAAVVTAPFCGLGAPVNPVVVTIGRAISYVSTRFSVPNDLKPEWLSHDEQVVKAYAADPLVFKIANGRWFSQALEAQAYIAEHADELTKGPNAIPVLIVQGSDDKIVDVNATRVVGIRGGDKVRYVELPGLYHEILNETPREREQAFSEIIQFLNQHSKQ